MGLNLGNTVFFLARRKHLSYKKFTAAHLPFAKDHVDNSEQSVGKCILNRPFGLNSISYPLSHPRNMEVVVSWSEPILLHLSQDGLRLLMTVLIRYAKNPYHHLCHFCVI